MRVHLSQIEKTLPVLASRYPELFETQSRATDAGLASASPRSAETGAVGPTRPHRRGDSPAALRPAKRTPA